jgi:hypothetical protein
MSDSKGSDQLPYTSGPAGFEAGELIECSKCRRSNPPDRPACLYCGTPLPVKDAAALRIDTRPFEQWESGINVVWSGREVPGLDARRGAAGIVGIEESLLQNAFAPGVSIPLARVRTEAEAESLKQRLAEAGVEAAVVSDAGLTPEVTPKRLRAITFDDDGGIRLMPFNNSEEISVPAGEMLLIVSGQIYEIRSEVFEQRKRGTSKAIDESETHDDLAVIDLYTKAGGAGFRIPATGFDFGCLGTDRSLLARENIGRLLERLREACPRARVDASYGSLRGVLDQVWEPARSRASQGIRRTGLGKKALSVVETVSNREQFTKYSRLQRKML